MGFGVSGGATADPLANLSHGPSGTQHYDSSEALDWNGPRLSSPDPQGGAECVSGKATPQRDDWSTASHRDPTAL